MDDESRRWCLIRRFTLDHTVRIHSSRQWCEYYSRIQRRGKRTLCLKRNAAWVSGSVVSVSASASCSSTAWRSYLGQFLAVGMFQQQHGQQGRTRLTTNGLPSPAANEVGPMAATTILRALSLNKSADRKPRGRLEVFSKLPHDVHQDGLGLANSSERDIWEPRSARPSRKHTCRYRNKGWKIFRTRCLAHKPQPTPGCCERLQNVS